jgi:hypothetical protein
VEDEYMNDFKRMALALTSAQMAKNTGVKQFGIGEEVPTHFLGWSPLNLVLVCQMTPGLQKESHDDRVFKSDRLCTLLRKNWWVVAITMVTEGYCSLDSIKTKDLNLSEAYLDSSYPVYECLTVSHVSEEDGRTNLAMVASPYKVGIGKVVTWNETLVYPEKPDKHLAPSRYSLMLRRSMSVQPDEDLNHTKMDEARSEIQAMGFSIQEFI